LNRRAELRGTDRRAPRALGDSLRRGEGRNLAPACPDAFGARARCRARGVGDRAEHVLAVSGAARRFHGRDGVRPYLDVDGANRVARPWTSPLEACRPIRRVRFEAGACTHVAQATPRADRSSKARRM